MANESQIPSAALPDSVFEKLRQLRRRIRLWFTFDGLSRLCAAILALGALDLLIDWHFRMDKPQRGVMLVLMLAALLWVCWRYLIQPLSAKLTDEALCLEVESRNKQLGEKLISALEFSRADWSQHPNASGQLVTATIEQAAEEAKTINFGGILRGRKYAANILCFALLGGLVLGLVAVIPTNQTMATWFNRNVLIGDASWPQDFSFAIEGASGQAIIVPKGDEWPMVARVRDGFRRLPKEVKLEFRGPDGSRSETMDRQKDGRTFRYFMPGMSQSMELRLVAEKLRTDWYAVKLVDRPTFESIDLRVTPPKYTGTPVDILPAGSGPYQILKGSSLHLRGRASKPLSRATLTIGSEHFELPVQGQEFQATVDPAKLLSATYLLEIEDTEPLSSAEGGTHGLGAKEPTKFKVKMQDDAIPKVTLVASGISNMVTPNARIPYLAKIADDYGLTEVSLHWQWREDKSTESEGTERSRVPSGIGEKLGDKEMDFEDMLDLEGETIPEGSRLSLALAAKDNDTLGGPKRGESTNIVLRVVSDADLRADLLRREKEQREVFAEMVNRQDALYTETQALAAETRERDVLTSDQRTRFMDVQKRQKLLGSNLEPLLKRLADMLREIHNNRLEEADGVIQRRLQGKVIDPLRGVAENELKVAASLLDEARHSSSDKTAREKSLAEAARGQSDALGKMREVLAHMVKNEGYQQALNLLYDVQKSQEDVRQRTGKEKQEFLKKLDSKEQNQTQPAPAEVPKKP